MKSFWEERYSREEFAYGTLPNKFFKEQIDKIKPGKLLLIGEGEGRNAVYAAKLGWVVDALDFSEEAKKKALRLAEINNVFINYDVENLDNFVPQKDFYDAAGLIFIHLENQLRDKVHTKCIESLKPGGKIILEAFEKEQFGRKSGGPQNPDLLYTLEDIKTNFSVLRTELLIKDIKNLDEGEFHSGEAAVIQYVGIR
jgi:SAM-dependent methyltransferase